MRRLLLLTLLSAVPAFAAAPPAEETRRDPARADAAEPAIELHAKGDVLTYTYDLAPIFDAALWKVLEDNGYSEILIQVSVVDAGQAVRLKQHHRLEVTLLGEGKVQLTSGPGRATTYPSREAMLKALRAVPGKPIAATEFSGDQGYLDMLVLVNPVQVFDYPAGPRDDGVAVGERTVYDRRAAARSRPIAQP
ncbi:MAG: hypothetical protein IV100_09145 [Myxococcales bacterium]|nr:hypothetical protein [Myxococcales bacterium]